MNTNEFRIITNLKKFIISLDNILINFPKKEKVLKDKIKETSYEVLELIEYTNLITDKINYQYQIISKLSMLDFYFEESLKKKYISETSLGRELEMENNNIFNLLKLYDNEISKNVKNKNKLIKFERHKLENIVNICNCINEDYFIKHYNIFLVYEPKVRVIMSLNIHDKLINHFMTRYVLEPKLTKYLDNRNIATRVGLGCDYGIKLINKYINKMKKYNNFYILKLDIKKYFYNINHDKLKEMIKNDLNNIEYKIICNIIDSTNEDYINKIINKLGKDLPLYQKGRGLPIG